MTHESQVANSSSAEEESNRVYSRRPYTMTQRCAPVRGNEPHDDDFQEVECLDLSEGGVSLRWPVEPDFSEAVVVLRASSNEIKMRVRVARITKEDDTFILGCQFVSRCG